MNTSNHFVDSSKITSTDRLPINLSILCYNTNNISPLCKIYNEYIEWRIKKKGERESSNTFDGKNEDMKLIEKVLCTKDRKDRECQSFLVWKALKINSGLEKGIKNNVTSHLTKDEVHDSNHMIKVNYFIFYLKLFAFLFWLLLQQN